MKLRWSPQACVDLEAGVDHIAFDNLSAALAVEERIFDAVGTLCEFPKKGRLRPDGRRELVVRNTPYLVIYRISNSVEILRIWHTSREPYQEP